MLAMIKRLPAIRARQLSHCYRKKVRARRTCRSADHICSASRAPRWFAWANVRFGSEPDNKRSRRVRFTPQEGTLQGTRQYVRVVPGDTSQLAFANLSASAERIGVPTELRDATVLRRSVLTSVRTLLLWRGVYATAVRKIRPARRFRCV